MPSLNPEKLAKAETPMSTSWLLGACMEARGKQDLWIRQKPEVLEVLRELAIIQSVESSNRIEGVTIPPARLRPIVLGKARPRNRSEEELAGYRKALNWIFNRKRRVGVTGDLIKKLHLFAQGGFSGDAGQWKKRNNEIVEILPDGKKRIRFVPTGAKDTPAAVKLLCANYDDACENERIPLLIVISLFVFDLLCIHPFRDGNGRVARLIAAFLLQQHGFQVGRYVSLERLIEEDRDEYYRTLAECSRGWHKGTNEIVPWCNYFLGILRQAYGEFEKQVESSESRPAKSDIIRQTILAQVGHFTLADLGAQVPSASSQLIRKVLSRMKKAGNVRLTGRGRGARWETIR